MADISKISPDAGTTEYNVKDATARSDIASIVEKIPVNASSSNKFATEADIASAYHAAGTKTVAELLSSLLVAANEGNVYNMTDAGTTTADFIEGAGKPIRIGDNVGVCKVGNDYKFDLLSGFIDTSNFVEKSSTSGLLKNDGTVDTTSYVEAETGKGLSTNDYDATAKGKVDGMDASIAASQNVSTALLKDTVGWTGKNLNGTKYTSKTETDSTVWTVNSNGSVSVSGTTNAKRQNGTKFTAPYTRQVKMSGGISTDAYILAWDDTAGDFPYTDSTKTAKQSNKSTALNSEVEFYMESGHEYVVMLQVNSGTTVNGTFYPMLCDVKIKDSTYEPPHASVEEIVSDLDTELLNMKSSIEVKGDWDCRNILPYPIGTKQVIASDGTITDNSAMYLSDYINVSDMNKIVWNGTISGNVNFRIARYDSSKTFIDRVIVSANTAFILDPAKYIRVCFEDDGSNKITNGILQNYNNINKDYTPHRNTLDSELSVDDGLSEITDIITSATILQNESWLRKESHIINMQIRLNEVTSNANDTLLKLPLRFRSNYTCILFISNASTGALEPGYMLSSGDVKCRSALSNKNINICGTWIKTT